MDGVDLLRNLVKDLKERIVCLFEEHCELDCLR